MISPNKIDEWIREVEERPSSAELIIRYIAKRLSELAARDEELVAQNIELLSGRKVEEYESRIASLEYQLELLKRQLGGEVVLPSEAPVATPVIEKINILVYNPFGQVLRFEVEAAALSSGERVGQLSGEVVPNGLPFEVLATSMQEELLLIFDTGRTVRYPVSNLPSVDSTALAWQNAFLEEPKVKEELAAIEPIGKMPLFELCIQASRRGYVKKMKTSFFTAHLEADYIGSGVKVRADKTCGVTFANLQDRFVMVSQEGYIFSMPAERLPTAIEEVIQLGNTDHIVSTFITGQKPSLLFITQNGKAVQREVNWLEPANTFKSRGQSILSAARREAGTRIVGAAPVDGADWGVVLYGDGSLAAYRLDELMARGSVERAESGPMVFGFTVITMPDK